MNKNFRYSLMDVSDYFLAAGTGLVTAGAIITFKANGLQTLIGGVFVLIVWALLKRNLQKR